ncbi:hypothetical protein [Vibrio echinoideorum]|uniref:Uncharacterized protein n=1 Tax=Vibrio echinoideorum TaxID=2100116 RepID=A0ABU9FRL3_9VIBR
MEIALPITVIFAVALFLVKEILEMVRKSQAKQRKLQAFKAVLKEELELNLWSWKKFESLLNRVRDAGQSGSYCYFTSPAGTERFEVIDEQGHGTGQVFPKVETEFHSKLLVDVAELDAEMYLKLLASYKALSELQHLRNRIVDFLNEDQNSDVENFANYTLEDLSPLYDELDKLYQYCTGSKLTEHRMR